MSETELSHGIREALRSKGCKVLRIQSGILRVQSGSRSYFVHTADKGTPDLLVIREPAVYTWLEVKAPGGKLSAEQRAWHNWAKKAGLRVATVDSIRGALAAVFAA